MSATARKRLSYAEYLAAELVSEVKHEFIDGVVLAMAGGTPDHALLAMNLGGELYAALKGRPCRPYSSDLRVRIHDQDASTYPDVTVICGEPQFSDRDRLAPTNPTALFEVSSTSTAEYDRTVKFDLYSKLPSLRHYVIVSHRSQRVEVYTRSEAGTWQVERHLAGDVARLSALDCTLTVADVYAGTSVPETDPELHRIDFLKEGLAEYGQRPAES